MYMCVFVFMSIHIYTKVYIDICGKHRQRTNSSKCNRKRVTKGEVLITFYFVIDLLADMYY